MKCWEKHSGVILGRDTGQREEVVRESPQGQDIISSSIKIPFFAPDTFHIT